MNANQVAKLRRTAIIARADGHKRTQVEPALLIALAEQHNEFLKALNAITSFKAAMHPEVLAAAVSDAREIINKARSPA